MKAMLFADWMNIRRSMKALLWVFAVMAVSAFAYGGSAFIPFLVTMLSVMGPATLMSTDRAYGWDRLSLTLPVSRRDIVSSKFTVSLALNAAMFLLGVVLTMVFSAVHRDGSLAENLLGLLGCEAAALLLMGIEFDLILRFGTERGRYFLLGVVWVPIIADRAEKPSGVQPSGTGGRRHGQLAREQARGIPRRLSRGLRSGLRPLLADRDQNLSEKRILSRQAAAGRIILALSAYDKAKERGEWGFF